jgi:hypothetical protein
MRVERRKTFNMKKKVREQTKRGKKGQRGGEGDIHSPSHFYLIPWYMLLTSIFFWVLGGGCKQDGRRWWWGLWIQNIHSCRYRVLYMIWCCLFMLIFLFSFASPWAKELALRIPQWLLLTFLSSIPIHKSTYEGGNCGGSAGVDDDGA